MTALHVSFTMWAEVCKKIPSAVVFADNAMLECLHWNGGLLRILDAGAVDIKEFSINQCGKPNQHKAVFLLSSCVLGNKLQMLRTVVESSSFRHCIVITTASLNVHHFVESSDNNWFHILEEHLQDWMGSEQYLSEVLQYPLFTCSIGTKLFVTPAFNNLFPITDYDMERLILLQRTQHKVTEHKTIRSMSDVDFSCLPINLQIEITHFVNCFHQLLASIDTKEDILTLGHLSRIVGSELENMQSAKKRRKTATNKTTLLFFDRTLDMTSASSHIDSTLMDKIQASLPRLPGHNNDVGINMNLIVSKSYEFENPEEIWQRVLPGCLSHSENPEATSLLDSILINKPKETLNEMHRILVKTATKKSPSVRVRITSPDTLEKLVSGFCGDYDLLVKHSGVLEVCLAATQSLKSSNVAKLEQLLGIEKVLLQNLSIDGATSVLNQFVQLIQTRHDRQLPIEDLAILLIHVYSLAGKKLTNHRADEEKLRGVIAEALVYDADVISEDMKEFIGSCINEMTVHLAVEKLFEKLQAISNARNGFKKYYSLYQSYGDTKPATSIGLLEQLLVDITDPKKPELSDIQYHSSGLTDMFKSRLGLFMNMNQPHPTDNKTMIIYVFGGITAHEVARIIEISKMNSNLEVLVGSTKLLTPRDLIKSLLISDSLLEY